MSWVYVSAPAVSSLRLDLDLDCRDASIGTTEFRIHNRTV